MIYVLYHSNCYDGFGAAYSAWKRFGSGAKYIPVSYGQPPPEMPDATEIYILDFSYDRQTLLDLSLDKRVIVLDHHKTAEETLRDLIGQYRNLEIHFDMNRSGALITWEYLHPEIPVPLLISHISDRDLWKFELTGSKEVHAALVSTPFDFEVWDNLFVNQLYIEGAACIKFQDQLVKNIVHKAWKEKIDGHLIPVVNTSSSWSEVGHALLERFPDAPFVACFTVMDNSIMWSLRSAGEFDVSAVAKKFGGGGHKNAAGFKTPKY